MEIFDQMGQILSLFISVLMSLAFAVTSYADDIFAPARGSGLLLGSGYNSVSGATGGNCVELSELVTLESAVEALRGLNQNPQTGTAECQPSGQCVEYNLSQITSASELRNSLNIDAKASFGFGAFSADASFNYYKNNRFTSNNIYIVLSVKVMNATERFRRWVLTPEAHAILAGGNLTRFLAECGDSLIAGRTTGGEFSAVIKIETRSNDYMSLDQSIADQIESCNECQIFLRMTPNGNNKWRFGMESLFTFKDEATETSQVNS